MIVAAMGGSGRQLLCISGVSKSFPGVKALDGVTVEVCAGEVHGLVGENGAGKSTLMAIASGALAADEGSVTINGTRMDGNPKLARELGLAIVRQEPALMPDLSVAENLYLGLDARLRPPLRQLDAWATGLLRRWSDRPSVNAGDRVDSLNPEQRFIVEIVKALACEPSVLVLDEPTEHLPPEDVGRLFERIRALTARGAAVVYISHRIREVREIADRLTVLRDGQGQGTHDANALTEDQIVTLIVGAELDREFPAKLDVVSNEPDVLVVDRLTGAGFADVSLAVRRGEIVGLAGIDANGQREFMRALAGLNPGSGGVRINGHDGSIRGTRQAARAGVRYVPGDRHREGIFADLPVRENFSLRSLDRDSTAGILHPRHEAQRARDAVARYGVKTPTIETRIGALSGGNQQKLVLAGVLESATAVMLVDEPTQGVDVGTRMEIYKTLRETAARGVAIIVVSSDANEIAGLCDRVLVFSRGRIVRELAGTDVTESRITSAVLTSTSVRDRVLGSVGGFWKWAAGDSAPIAMVAIAIVAMGAYASAANEFYLSTRNLGGMMVLMATLALVAYGQQALMLIGGIDLSVGPLMGLIQVLASFYLLPELGGAHQALGWGLIVVAAIAVGLLNWLLVDRAGLHPMVATLATFMAIQAVSLLLRPVAGGMFDNRVTDVISARIGFVPVTLIAAVLLALALEFVLFRHRLGLVLRGFGSRPEVARIAGVPPRRTRILAYVGCSALAGLAAITMLSQVGIGDPRAGLGYTLTSIAAVVIGGASLFGGRGSFLGALLGAAFITQVNAVTTFLNLDTAWQSYLLGAMILAAVALYSKSRQMAVAA